VASPWAVSVSASSLVTSRVVFGSRETVRSVTAVGSASSGRTQYTFVGVPPTCAT